MRTLAGDRRDARVMKARELKRTWSRVPPALHFEPGWYDEQQRERRECSPRLRAVTQ